MNQLLRSRIPSSARLALCLFLPWLVSSLAFAQPKLDVVEFSSSTLRGNPLHDPVTRRLAVFIPPQTTNGLPLPVVYYLPGYGGSSDRFISNSTPWLKLTQKIADEVTPVLLVVVDGRTHWGGSQYLNSPAQGNYADYVSREIVSVVQTRYPTIASRKHRIIAGHSSGGFGALRLGIMRSRTFEGVIALSPDSDFELTHLPLVQLASVSNAPLTEITRLMKSPEAAPPKDGDLVYALGLSAAYASVGRHHPGEFEWLYDDGGHFRQQVWERWMDNDPLTIVHRRLHAFRPKQAVYLEGAAQDQFLANVGARKIYDILKNRKARCVFYEPPGKHGDHMPERLQRGLAWFFKKPLQDIR